MIKLAFCLFLSMASTLAFAEKWTNAGNFKLVELGKTHTIEVYGDADSAVRTGDFASLMVKGFHPTVAKKVNFECIKEEISWENGERANIRRDYQGEYALLPASVMTKLHGMACKRWFEVWK